LGYIEHSDAMRALSGGQWRGGEGLPEGDVRHFESFVLFIVFFFLSL